MRPFLSSETSPYYPQRSFCHSCSELGFAIFFYLPIAILSLLAGAPFVPFVSCLRWRNRRRRPHRPPSSVSVAIIGGGWSGLQLAARLQELGVAWHGFEAASDFGGTWHPQNRYASLALHTCAWLASFAGFPYSNDPQTRATRPTGAEMHAYLCRFAEHHRLRRGFHFNSRVTRIAASSKSRTATLAVARPGGGEVQHGPYDLIIFASIASEPHVPHLSHSDGYYAAGGRQIHASECSDAILSQLVDASSHVAVVGGSKSAADIVLALVDRGMSSERLTWVYRRPYVFFKFERFFHGARSALGMVRACAAFVAFCAAWAVPHLSLRLCSALDYTWMHRKASRRQLSDSPCCDAARCTAVCALNACCCCSCSCCCEALFPEPEEWKTMRYGVLDASQRRTLDEEVSAVVGNPTRLVGGDGVGGDGVGGHGGRYGGGGGGKQPLGIEIEQAAQPSGSPDEEGAVGGNVRASVTARADVIIWASGYTTGIDRIQYLLDAKPLERPPHAGPLFNDFLCADYPCLAISGAFFTSSGPMAARAAADLACWHLCVRPRLSGKKLRKWSAGISRAKDRDLGNSELGFTYRHGSGAQHMLFLPGFWSNVIWLQIGLIIEGVAPWHEVLGGLFNILVLNRQRPLELGLLGMLEPGSSSGKKKSAAINKDGDVEDALLAPPPDVVDA